MSYTEHKCQSFRNVKCAVLTVSDSRSRETDDSGKIISEKLEEQGHLVAYYNIIKDDLEAIQSEVKLLLDDENIQAIIINGGTGISRKDVTIEAVMPYIEKELEGFGELFRFLSYKEIGSSAMMSRALAGKARDKVVICLPGSPNAVKLGLEKLIIPELGHMVWEASR